jgi:penicillin-binding protein 1C
MTRKNRILGVIVLAIVPLVFYFFSLPGSLFTDPYSTVLKASGGELLSASIASDGQWRFPESDSVSAKFSEALIAYEDKRFRSHPGVDILSLGRAVKQNISDGKVVSGGSTITMQVIRLSRKGKPRTIFQKSIEIILATRLELRYSKEEILALYASHAPFGGNVVGLDAACWRYFGRDPRELSWGEAALLAVLPNSPSLMHPGKNRNQLKAKRDRLLDKLLYAGKIDAFTCTLSKEEPIPSRPEPLPRYARHLLSRAMDEQHAGRMVQSTVQYELQLRAEQILQDHHQRLKGNEIHNAAAIVLEVSTGNVLAYVGNVNTSENAVHGNEVDVIASPRSTGSILKPFLFAAMLDEGKILPRMLLPDVPLTINGFTPQNFSKGYDGAVPANMALIRSLNIPAVQMLKTFRYEKFHSLLRNMGMQTLTKSPDHYGLSLILGGAEGTLWDITGMYASMARTLNNYAQHPGSNRYLKKDFHNPTYIQLEPSPEEGVALEESSWLRASSIYQTFDALKELYRPGEDSGWKYFSSSKKIAWKTGTSFGFRDGWAVGVTPHYVVGVWVGNADGEGRPGLTGTDAAAPIMFDIFSQLRESSWFKAPSPEMEFITVCRQSGFRSGANCNGVDTVRVGKDGLSSLPCPYHKIVHTSRDGKFRVHLQCEPVEQVVQMKWFVLPPMQEFYFKRKNFSYMTLPPLRQDCQPTSTLVAMDLIYPKPGSKLFIPRELDGRAGKVVFELAHANPSIMVYWHLDGNYLGSTKGSHNLPLHPGTGTHHLTLVDDNGESINYTFDVISNM